MTDTIHYCKDCAEADKTLGAYRLWKCRASKYPNLVAGGSLFKTCEEARKRFCVHTPVLVGNEIGAKCNCFKAIEKGEDNGEDSDSAD